MKLGDVGLVKGRACPVLDFGWSERDFIAHVLAVRHQRHLDAFDIDIGYQGWQLADSAAIRCCERQVPDAAFELAIPVR